MEWESTQAQILKLCGHKETPWLIVGQPVEMVRLDCSAMQIRREDPLDAVNRALLRLAEISHEGITAKDAHGLLGVGSILSYLLLIRLETLGLLRIEENPITSQPGEPPPKNACSRAHQFPFIAANDPAIDASRFFITAKGRETLRTNVIVDMNVEPVSLFYWANPLRVVPEAEVPPDVFCVQTPPSFFTHSLKLNPEHLIPQSDGKHNIPGMSPNYCGPTPDATITLTYVVAPSNGPEVMYPAWFYFTVRKTPEGDKVQFFHEIWAQRDLQIKIFTDKTVLKKPTGSFPLSPVEIGQTIILNWIHQKIAPDELKDAPLLGPFVDDHLKWRLDPQYLECWLNHSQQSLLQEEPVWVSAHLGSGQWAACNTKLVPNDTHTAEIWFEWILKTTLREATAKFHDFDPISTRLQKQWRQNWQIDFDAPPLDEFLITLWDQREYELVYQLREDVDLPYDGTATNTA